MEKVKVLSKVRELAKANHMFYDSIAINQAEIAVIMQTFGMSWDELRNPSDTFSLEYQMVRTENDLRKEFEGLLFILKLSKEKDLHKNYADTRLMMKGFISGIQFFNQDLANELSLIADKELQNVKTECSAG
ncbi:hypothetical protein [Paenibacillus xylanexedens]|uniref:hypothetical protein n=1 Tax=Paenibacillus xylanexedens TaxID=528191 RepID=UPI000F52ED51|nr:hypothetical protein [Paenibacillus xylanexedens]RPK20110.1 hypothetical protein EDO6_06649 [Paenibacillus xylanexedens]